MSRLAQRIAGDGPDVVLRGPDRRAATVADLARCGATDVGAADVVALALADPFDAVRALAALDGRVAALLMLSRGMAPDVAGALMDKAGCTLCVTDRADLGDTEARILNAGALTDAEAPADPVATRWLMTTSGTTGLPKIVPHDLRTLTQSVYRFAPGVRPVWGLLYDPTRFAGLQVVLQALTGGGTLVVADPHAAFGDQVATLAQAGCTHLSATPTFWRRILMTPGHADLPLRQVTLGGEIADQSTLDALKRAYPDARVTHIYASTEAGVGFSVTDGRAGFPADWLTAAPGRVDLRVHDGLLWLRPSMTALAPGAVDGIEVDDTGFVNSGDRIEIAGDRATFKGRDSGLINVGGAKVHPETVEAVIQTVPGVAMVQVSGKPSPVMGALVLAEIQPEPGADPDALRAAVKAACRDALPREAMPASLRFVDGFDINASGKIVRTGKTAS